MSPLLAAGAAGGGVVLVAVFVGSLAALCTPTGTPAGSCQPGPGKTPPYCPHAGTAESSTITAIDPIRKNTQRFLIGFSLCAG